MTARKKFKTVRRALEAGYTAKELRGLDAIIEATKFVTGEDISRTEAREMLDLYEDDPKDRRDPPVKVVNWWLKGNR